MIERLALNRPISDVDDSDTYVCRPHRPGEIRVGAAGPAADVGAPARQEHVVRDLRRRPVPPAGSGARACTSACRAGSSSPTRTAGRPTAATTGNGDGPRGTSGTRGSRSSFDDGTRMVLVDPRRLGRVRLDPPVETLGPDAREITSGAVPGDDGPGDGAGQGPPARPGRAGRRRQPARRPGTLAGPDQPGPAGRRTVPGGGGPAVPGRCAAAIQSAVEGGGVHTLSVLAARTPGRRLSAVRRTDGPGQDRRPHDVVVHPRTGLTDRQPCAVTR